MTAPDFETELNRLYSQASAQEDEAEFAARLELRLRMAALRRAVILGTLGTIGVIGTAYWAPTVNVSSIWSASADYLFTTLADTPFQVFIAVPLVLFAVRFRTLFERD